MFMGVQVIVGEGQDIDQALCEFRNRVRREYQHQWYKRRYGYYESPGQLRRKRKKMQRLRGGDTTFCDQWALKLYIGERELFERTGPTLAAGK